jgi:HAD superfamily hydrolase (TIGR01484 family)
MKILLSDFDGTLLQNSTINPVDRRKINEFREKNLFVIATGRSKESLEKAYWKYGFDFFDYAICSNGGCIIDENYSIIDDQVFSVEDKEQIFKVIMTLDFNVIVSTRENTFHESCNNVRKFYKQDIYCITLFNEDQQVVKKTYENLKDNRYLSNISFSNNGKYIDFSPSGVNKYTSYINLTRFLSEIPSEIFAIGDDENDIVMLENANKSFTFSKSKDLIKKSVSTVVDCYSDIFELII